MNDKKLEEINLRLKQLVALKHLEALHESYNIFPEEEDWTLDRVIEDEARDRYQAELKEATRALDKLNEGGEKGKKKGGV